ncbi:helix-turn-helix domain-containing protein [Rivularia sp. UHCC 0363]|uniref:helix-turn-helix domain-containing protein n=1 Tax=Rivularia sp. UHCC 0363 TaxID=3110244 RepID=UPI002B1F8504|nr:helix-turn-helix domain-containing protein [Rivularia sp. UHCC 0363]MEA5594684.1 helix-turn-helix domain-containing protein [Rivularia sp. UHCC 0363]
MMLNLPASIISEQQEKQSLQEIERILALEAQTKLVGANGEQIDIPASVHKLLHQIVRAIALGQTVSIVPQQQEFTTQQAADYLNVSRPYLIKLLEQGEIAFIKVGTHRRICFDDLIDYKEQRDVKRRELLQQLVEISEEAGLYEDE